MKLLVLFMLFIMVVGLLSQQLDMEAFSAYQKEANRETFLKAYHALVESENQVILSYLLLMELHRYVDEIEYEKLENRHRFSYANLLLELGKYKESITVYEKLNEASPNWSCPWRHKGEAYYKMRQFAKAEIALKKAIETRAEHFDAYIWLAKVQKEMGKNKEALKTFNTGISYKGKDIEDPEEEIHPLDEMFLELELYKLNKMKKEYAEMKKKMKEIAPNDERWSQF
jgi:tetratricopeptide (TPR) repeat protein